MSEDMRIIDLTVRELRDIISTMLAPQNETSTDTSIAPLSKDLRYGIPGLADLLGCSKRYAQEMKSRGVFDEAITQVGRKIIINADKALELYARIQNR